MDSTTKFPWQQEAVILQSSAYYVAANIGQVILDQHIEGLRSKQALFEAPFVLISHGTEEDPILNYGNRLALWLCGWLGLCLHALLVTQLNP